MQCDKRLFLEVAAKVCGRTRRVLNKTTVLHLRQIIRSSVLFTSWKDRFRVRRFAV